MKKATQPSTLAKITHAVGSISEQTGQSKQAVWNRVFAPLQKLYGARLDSHPHKSGESLVVVYGQHNGPYCDAPKSHEQSICRLY